MAKHSSQPIRRLLIANRGEIACRIIRSCKLAGITPLAVFSEADRYALHTRLATESLCIGEGEAQASYLNGKAVLDAAIALKADAIHPGYGFLSENAEFAKQVEQKGIRFIGPSPESMRAVGDKLAAKALAALAKVPVAASIGISVSTSKGKDAGKVSNLEALKSFTKTVGFPIIVKASGGGGGRGMRKVYKATELEEAIASASREAQSAFGNATVFCEKLIENARHIEVQILGDHHGTVLALSDRDCTMQRKHQKVLEEAPAPALEAHVRQALHQSAVSLMKAAKYANAGTVEFLLDKAGSIYFLEVNSRLQVEHPVTEMVLGIDLVALQIAVAEGAKLTDLLPNGLSVCGHAIEARVCAENPETGFIPSTGMLSTFSTPQQSTSYFESAAPSSGTLLRVDTGFERGDRISHFYDSLAAKVIVHAPNRAEAITSLRAALSNFLIEGVHTNRHYLLSLLKEESFAKVSHSIDSAGSIQTQISPRERWFAVVAAALWEILGSGQSTGRTARHTQGGLPNAIGACGSTSSSLSPWSLEMGHRQSARQSGAESSGTTSFQRCMLVDSLPCQVEISGLGLDSTHSLTATVKVSNDGAALLSGRVQASISKTGALAFTFESIGREFFFSAKALERFNRGEGIWVHGQTATFRITLVREKLRTHSSKESAHSGEITSHLPGKILSLKVKVGDTVAQGDVLVVLESMKMEHRIEAPSAGRVREVSVTNGQTIEAGKILLSVETN